MAFLRNHSTLILVIVLFIASMLFINPLRETAMQDDWAYARTVRHLLDTGEYQLDEWLSANMPFQAYWGSLFTQIFGYSHGALRLSTLALELLGLLACYGLGSVYGFSRTQAALLALVLFVSPVALQLSYTFMTDVPLMSLLLIALYFYTKSLRDRNTSLAIAGSIAAGAAILTRQFGVAILLGWGAVWLFDRNRWRALKLYTAGAVIPTMVMVWQLYIGSVHPNFAARYTFEIERLYLTQAPPVLIGEIFWRIFITSLYLALYIAPLAVTSAILYSKWLRNPLQRRKLIIALYLSTLAVIVTIFATGQRGGWTIMPFLPWNLFVRGWAQVFLTGVTVFSGILLFPLFAQRIRGFRRLELHEKLLDLLALFSLLLILVFFQIGDEYLLVLIPFALFAVARQLRDQLASHSKLLFVTCAVALVLAAFWTRYQLAASEAEWRAADTLLTAGVPADDIRVIYTWTSYQGSFDEYISSKTGPLSDAFVEYFDWLAQRYLNARYIVTRDPGAVRGEIIYHGQSDELFFQQQEIYAIHTDDKTP